MRSAASTGTGTVRAGSGVNGSCDRPHGGHCRVSVWWLRGPLAETPIPPRKAWPVSATDERSPWRPNGGPMGASVLQGEGRLSHRLTGYNEIRLEIAPGVWEGNLTGSRLTCLFGATHRWRPGGPNRPPVQDGLLRRVFGPADARQRLAVLSLPIGRKCAAHAVHSSLPQGCLLN